MSKFDHEQICQSLGMYDECYEDDGLEECPHCGEWFEWEVNADDEVYCPHCLEMVWAWVDEAPQGVDVGDVPF